MKNIKFIFWDCFLGCAYHHRAHYSEFWKHIKLIFSKLIPWYYLPRPISWGRDVELIILSLCSMVEPIIFELSLCVHWVFVRVSTGIWGSFIRGDLLGLLDFRWHQCGYFDWAEYKSIKCLSYFEDETDFDFYSIYTLWDVLSPFFDWASALIETGLINLIWGRCVNEVLLWTWFCLS